MGLYLAEFWHSLKYFNLYRFIIAGFFIITAILSPDVFGVTAEYIRFFILVSFGYLVTVVASFVLLQWRYPNFVMQLGIQVVTDIFVFSLLLFAAGGTSSSLALLLLISLAAAGLVSRGRITLFAALATLATLIEHTFSVFYNNALTSDYFRVGLLSLSYFAVAWLAHTLAKSAVQSQELAQQRGRDLLSLSEANRLVMRDVRDGVLVLDGKGVIKQLNHSAEKMLRRHIEPNTDVSVFPVLYAQLGLWKKSGRNHREVVQLSSGVRTRLRFVAVERDATHGVVVFMEDLQRVQTEAQQIKLAALGRLTANIAHEIRNPLSAISYATELLREDVQDEEQRRLIAIVLDNTKRINHIVQDVMQLNRRDRTQAIHFELNDYLRQFIQEFQLARQLTDNSVQLNEESRLDVYFDRDHLRRILWNLTANAWRHSQQQTGSVSLIIRQVGARMWLDVIDDGAGVPKEQQAHLFEPFFTTEKEGNGLGLYIARELCEANGASLVYHEIDGQRGACFRVIFATVIQDQHDE